MNSLFLLQSGLLKSGLNLAFGVLTGLLLLRQFMVILAAEQGRKHDLVKKLNKGGQGFHLSLLVPFLDPNDHPALLQLLHAIHEQDYPASKVTVHLVTSEESHRDLVPQSLRANVKVWQYPGLVPRYENAISWLIERCLAAGGNGIFVFLKPTDMIKPDFLQNIASKGMDSFAIQGYVALKNPPDTPLAKVQALSTRVFNRIGNAGRFHLGLSCRLLDSGWAIKQEVLEMIPFHRGMDLDNLEYTLRLNLENFRVNWAPSVVVYSDSRLNLLDHFTQCAGAGFNRLRLLMQYGPALFTRLLMRFDINGLEQLLSTISPPYLAPSLTLALLTVLTATTQLPIPGEPLFWGSIAAITMVLNVMGLVVARCKSVDYATMLFYTPLTYLFGLATLPVSLFNVAKKTISSRPRRGSAYRTSRKTRFNEDMEAPPNLFDEAQGRQIIQGILKNNAPADDERKQKADLPRGMKKVVSLPGSKPSAKNTPANASSEGGQQAPHIRQPKETVRSVPLSNGKKQVMCRLKTLTTYNDQDQESYCLTLEYKSLSFSTESYRILDQAFYELHAKLVSRGLTVVTCGSCGNFYNPTADVPGALKNSGVCLFDKIGKEVNLNTDAVTVISQACDYHCPLDQREGIVRQWKESLTFSRSN